MLFEGCAAHTPAPAWAPHTRATPGPSGSGKSSLLGIIGGRSTARIEGSVTFNGSKLDKATKRKLGYVMQVGVHV